MALPEYKMIGDVKRIAMRGKHSTKWYQVYRVDGDPVRKTRRAPCCRDRLHSRRKAGSMSSSTWRNRWRPRTRPTCTLG